MVWYGGKETSKEDYSLAFVLGNKMLFSIEIDITMSVITETGPILQVTTWSSSSIHPLSSAPPLLPS